ncbi:hypothetical protein D3C75_136380 [compost metagenome]
MAVAVYLVVIVKDASSPKTESIEIVNAGSRAAEVINLAYNISTDDRDPRRIEKIMKVDTKGDVSFYDIEFHGKLRLREIPLRGGL